MSAAAKISTKTGVRQSDILAFQMCGLQWRFSRVDKIPSPANSNMMIGNILDQVNNANCLHRLEHGKSLKLDDAMDVALKAFEVEKKKTQFKADDPQDQPEAHENRIKFMTDVYISNMAPQINPAMPPQTKIEIKTEFPFDINGTLDVVEKGHMISDLKTTEFSKRNNFSVTGNIQAALYSLWYRTNFGVVPTWRYMLLFRPNQTEMTAWMKGNLTEEQRNGKVMFVEGKCSEVDFEGAMYAARQTYRMMEAEIYNTAPDLSWWCAEGQCGYWSICKGRK